MGRLVAEIEKERLFRRCGLNERDSAIREGIRAVVIRAEILEGRTIKPVIRSTRKVITSSTGETKEVIEAANHGIAAQMPFADESRAIPGLL